MKHKIIMLLEKYEDKIMQYTLGSSVDEYNKRYAEVYSWEWSDHKHDIAYVIANLIAYNTEINPIGFAYVIISEWSGVMTFSKGDLDIEKLTGVCEDIIKELHIS